ncbi:MAG TPA: hypothetical protein VNM70_20415 [Burkholderiales bacterium]|nr:hypothetical protein [Burkholderiales bacterium]
MNPDRNDQPLPLAYADEVLCANWHPLVLMLAEPLTRVRKTALDAVEAEDLLARLYSCQQA